MLDFEAVCKKILSGQAAVLKIFIGGLIAFIPILNLIALGYVRDFALQVRANGDYSLPDWRMNCLWPWLKGGALFFAAVLLYGVLPVAAVWWLCALANALTGGIAPLIMFLPFSLALAFSPAWVCAAHYHMGGVFNAGALLDVKVIFGVFAATWRRLALPLLAFWGLVLLSFALNGFANFLALLLFVPYCTLVFIHLENEAPPANAGAN